MNIFFKTLTLSFLLCSFGAECAEEFSKIKLELPINWTTSPAYNLEVTIPEGYTALQDFEDWDQATLIEFVPRGENGKNWSEMISINKFIGKKIKAHDFVTKLKEGMLAQAENGKVWAETHDQLPDYQKANLVLSYDYQQHHEMMGAQYVSGPFDCVGVQYTIRSNEDEKMLTKISNFFKTSTQISKDSSP